MQIERVSHANQARINHFITRIAVDVFVGAIEQCVCNLCGGCERANVSIEFSAVSVGAFSTNFVRPRMADEKPSHPTTSEPDVLLPCAGCVDGNRVESARPNPATLQCEACLGFAKQIAGVKLRICEGTDALSLSLVARSESSKGLCILVLCGQVSEPEDVSLQFVSHANNVSSNC